MEKKLVMRVVEGILRRVLGDIRRQVVVEWRLFRSLLVGWVVMVAKGGEEEEEEEEEEEK